MDGIQDAVQPVQIEHFLAGAARPRPREVRMLQALLQKCRYDLPLGGPLTVAIEGCIPVAFYPVVQQGIAGTCIEAQVQIQVAQ